MNRETSFFFKKSSELEGELSTYLGNSIFKDEKLTRLKRVSFLGILNYLEGVPENFRYKRYDHSLAVAHLSLRWCQNLSLSPLERLITLFAALLHDIAHGPFSHSAEGYFQLGSGYKQNHLSNLHQSMIHKILKKIYIYFPREIQKLFVERKLTEIIYWVIKGGLPKGVSEAHEFGIKLNPYLWQLFSTPLHPDGIDGDNRAAQVFSTIDKLDLSPIDPSTLIDAITKYEEPFVVDFEGSRIVDKYIRLQETLYEKIFFSEKAKAAEAMFLRAVELISPIKNFTKIDDVKLIEKINNNRISKEIWNQVTQRYLFIPFSSIDIGAFDKIINKYRGLKETGRAYIAAKESCESELADFLNIKPEYVILYRHIPYDWRAYNLLFSPSHRKNLLKIKWRESHGQPRDLKQQIFEIYIPAEEIS